MLNFNTPNPNLIQQPQSMLPIAVQPNALTDLMATRYMISNQLKTRNDVKAPQQTLGYAPSVMQPKRDLSSTNSFLTNASFGGFF